MNKIFSATLFAAGLMGITSCSDFLDQKSETEIDGDYVYSSTYYTGLRINKLYGGLTTDRTYSQDLAIVWNLNSDIELVDGLGDDAKNTTSERGNMNYNMSPSWSKIADVWDDIYEVIENANDAIEGIESSPLLTAGGSDQTTMEQYLGEALTLRALCYFDLVRIFGDVPMKFESSKSDLSNAYLNKTDRDIIMDSLMNHLDRAIELLPWAGENSYTTEHVTKGYAHGLLAQIAMTRAGYAIREQAKEGYVNATVSDATYPTQRPDDATRTALYERALKHLVSVIDSGPHKLNPSFENEWYLINQLTLDQTYYENLFELPMGLNVTGELGYTVGVRLNGVTSDYGYGNSTGKLKLTAPLLYSYDSEDERRDITIAPFEIKEVKKKTVESMLGNAPFGLYCGKWDARKMSDTWLSQNLTATAKHMTGINPVLMRYSQILLYYAECMNELNNGATGTVGGAQTVTNALEALRLVHNRAFSNTSYANNYINKLPTDKDGFFDAIVQENAWEFAGEGYRKWDLIRWGILVDKIKEFKNEYLATLKASGYQTKVYFNYTDNTKKHIDLSSITWYGTPAGKTEKDYDDSADSFGKANPSKTDDKTVYTQLPSISSGLVADSVEVVNRYIMPLASTTISASNGHLSNSYGYAQ